MANNRLYLCCINCGEKLYLDKNYGGPYEISIEKLSEINKFFEDHRFCFHEENGMVLAHGGDFCLIDEFDRDDIDKVIYKIKTKEMHKWESE